MRKAGNAASNRSPLTPRSTLPGQSVISASGRWSANKRGAPGVCPMSPMLTVCQAERSRMPQGAGGARIHGVPSTHPRSAPPAKPRLRLPMSKSRRRAPRPRASWFSPARCGRARARRAHCDATCRRADARTPRPSERDAAGRRGATRRGPVSREPRCRNGLLKIPALRVPPKRPERSTLEGSRQAIRCFAHGGCDTSPLASRE